MSSTFNFPHPVVDDLTTQANNDALKLALSQPDPVLAVLRESPINVRDPAYGAVGDGVTDDTGALNAAITAANAAQGELYVPPTAAFYKVTATLTTLTGATGICGVNGRSRIEGSVDGDILVLKGNLKTVRGLYVVNTATSYTNLSAAVRVRNCAYGTFEDIFTQCEHANAVGFMLEQVYDGSAADATTLVHTGCWYNALRNITAQYRTVTSVNIGHGVSFRVDASALGVVNPTGQPAGTYSGSVSFNELVGINVEGKARGLNLEHAGNNVIAGGQFIQCVDQVYGTDADANTFIGLKHNQWAGSPYNLDVSTSFSNAIINPGLFAVSASPWSLGTIGARPMVVANDEAIVEAGLTLNDLRIARSSGNSLKVVPSSGSVWNLQRPDDTAAAVRFGNGQHEAYGIVDFFDAAGAQSYFSVRPDQGTVQFAETGPPTAPAANEAYVFARDNGAGKTQLVALFPTGAAQVLATEP